MNITGRCDSDALRLAVERGPSVNMGHLRKHAQTSFLFLKECGIMLEHIPGIENSADLFTKIVSAEKNYYLSRKWFGHPVEKNPHGAPVRTKKARVVVIDVDGDATEQKKHFHKWYHSEDCPLYVAFDWGIYDETCTCAERFLESLGCDDEELQLAWQSAIDVLDSSGSGEPTVIFEDLE